MARVSLYPVTRLQWGCAIPYRLARARGSRQHPSGNAHGWTFTTVNKSGCFAREGDRCGCHFEPVRLAFSGALDAATLNRNIIVTPTVENVYTNFDAAANVYYLSWEKQPRTEYCVLLKPGIADVYGNVIAESRRSCFVTGDLPAFLSPAGAGSVVTLDASQSSQLYFTVQNRDRVAFTLSEVPEPDFVRGRDVAGAVIREWQETFTVPRNTPTVVPLVLRRLGGALPTGYYHLAWADPPWGTQSLIFAVVDRHLTLKLAAEEALVWVTDLRSGEPISRTAVRLVNGGGELCCRHHRRRWPGANPDQPARGFVDNVAAVVGEPGAAGLAWR